MTANLKKHVYIVAKSKLVPTVNRERIEQAKGMTTPTMQEFPCVVGFSFGKASAKVEVLRELFEILSLRFSVAMKI